MFISLSGQLGSGKSTLCLYLKNHKNFEIFSTGTIHRKLANERKLSTLEFNKLITGDRSFDLLIDEEMKKFAAENADTDTVFDSRMAWHFVKDSFKVFLLVSPKVAAERVFFNRVLQEEKYATKEDALKELIGRREIENVRFKEFYNVDCNDYKNYDLFIDTSRISTEEIADIIFCAYEYHSCGKPYKKCFISPQNIYPIGRLSPEEIKQAQRLAEVINNDPTGGYLSGLSSQEVPLIKIKNQFFLHDGLVSVMAAVKAGVDIMRADIVYDESGILPDGTAVLDYVRTNTTVKDIKAWEKEKGFVFGYYPEIIAE
ncbi:MAG: cytidylate kinase family protein [Clostridiales bacterium]|jgi:cytidylate kinase|nr:cytidylate kinase family protein [Clostridiales bacterium]